MSRTSSEIANNYYNIIGLESKTRKKKNSNKNVLGASNFRH